LNFSFNIHSIVLITVLFTFTQRVFSQATTRADELQALGRDSLLKMALVKLTDKGFDPAFYDVQRVKRWDDNIIVEFNASIVFASANSCFYQSVYVSLAGSGSGSSIYGSCDKPKYYTLSKSEKSKIDFVIRSINKSDEVGSIPDGKWPKGTFMKIEEKSAYYKVSVNSYSTFSSYKVVKKTGKIYEASHKHYAHDGLENKEVEIE